MASTIRSLLQILLVAFLFLTTVILIRTWTMSNRTDKVRECKSTDGDFIRAGESVLTRFRQALRFKTVSTERGVSELGELLKFGKFIQTAFPLVHKSAIVTQDRVGNYSLLYKVKGSNDSLTPFMLCSHLDVVPADPERWEVDPFSGEVKDGFIYGRGTIDVKQGVMGIMEAVEFLLSKGFQPRRTFYIGFGHDEEVGGYDGAKAIGDLMQSRGVKKLEFLVDEGLTIINNLFPGITKPLALVGTSEKGSLSIELKVTGEPGHSSMPKKESTISILANAVSRLESNPHPSMFGYGPEKDMFEHITSEMSFPLRVLTSNLWLFGPLLSWVLSQKPSTNAIVRTVTSVTIIRGGVKINVLPAEAIAMVNHRIHPAQKVQEVIDHDKKIIGDDRVQIRVMDAMEPLPMSPYGDEDFGYQTLKNSIRQVWTNAAVAPGVMIGNTDTRHYTRFTNNIYRFSPTVMYPEDLKRFHGDNERISVRNYEQAINFYYHLIQNADEAVLPPYHKHGEEL